MRPGSQPKDSASDFELRKRRPFGVVFFGAGIRFAVPGECPWRERLRPSPTAAQPATPLYPPPAAQGGWAGLSPPVRVGLLLTNIKRVTPDWG